MKKFIFLFSFFCWSHVFAGDFSYSLLSMDLVTIGETTFDEIRSIYGEADAERFSIGEDSSTGICYHNEYDSANSYLIFKTGRMAEINDGVTGFCLSFTKPKIACFPTQLNIVNSATKNGLKLGQTTAEFQKKMPVVFKKNKDMLLYQREKKLCSESTSSDNKCFDETIFVKGQFRDEKLIMLCIAKIISS
jgi:hypothetical protein